MTIELASAVTVPGAPKNAAVAAIRTAAHRDLTSHIRALAAAVPDRIAVAYLTRGEEVGDSITFAQMDRRARSLAAYFQQLGAQGARAIMLFDASVEAVYAFMGCVYGRVIAAPLPAPTSNSLDRYLLRVMNVIGDGGARFVLTTSKIRQRLQDIAKTMTGFEHVEWISVDELPDHSDRWVDESVDESDVVYLQYTSGSTSAPKGVMITHRNLVNVIAYMGWVSGCPEFGTSAVCWMPYFHDFGLIDGLLVPLGHGMSVYLMSPSDFVQQPIRWVNAIHRYRASHSSGPNFSFELLARKSTPEERARLDLSCWRSANNAAEPIHQSTISRFRKAFGPHGFAAEAMAPAYGLAEATLLVTMSRNGARSVDVDAEALESHLVELRAPDDATRTMIGCGRVWPGPWRLDVRVVNSETRQLTPAGEVGEVWVSGDLVAKGYWNRPVETAEKFHAEIVELPGVRYLRTGDLGFLVGDELVITGRRKDLIIVEGRNHYPQDIEVAAEKSHPGLRPGCSVAFSIETEDTTRVVLVCEIRTGYVLAEDASTLNAGDIRVSRKELERVIRREVAEEHQLRIHDIVILHPGLLPKTTSGKVERFGCKTKYIDGVLLQGVPRR